MTKELEVLHVDNGKICPTCPNCRFFKYLNAPKDVHKVAWRCSNCGQKTHFEINWRKSPRKECKEGIIASDAMARGRVESIGAFLCDMSLGGVSFTSAKINVLPGAKLKIFIPINRIRRKKGSGVELTIEITFRKGQKYGAKFLDLADGTYAKKEIYCWLMEK